MGADSERTGKETDCEFVWKRSKDIPDFEKNLFEGDFDFSYANPWHVVRAHDVQGYTPLIHSGSKKLKGILVVPKESLIEDVTALSDKEISFPAPNAFAASLIIRAELTKRFGMRIKPVYLGSHSNVYAHVAKAKVMAGGGVMGTFNEQSARMRENLKILYTSAGFTPHSFIAHPRTGADAQESMRRALLNLAAEKPELFDAIPMPDPVVSGIEDYTPMRDLHLEDFVVQTQSKH